MYYQRAERQDSFLRYQSIISCKKSSFISYTEEALKNVQHHIVELANKEGLHAHARAIEIRFEEEK